MTFGLLTRKSVFMRGALYFACSLLLLSGCTFLKEVVGLGIEKPKVAFVEANVTGLGLDGVSVVLSLEVQNPNHFELQFDKLKYEVSVGSLSLAKGEANEQIKIAANEKKLVKLPLTVSGGSALQLAKNLLTEAEVPQVSLVASADFGTPFGPVNIGFQERQPLKKLLGAG